LLWEATIQKKVANLYPANTHQDKRDYAWRNAGARFAQIIFYGFAGLALRCQAKKSGALGDF